MQTQINLQKQFWDLSFSRRPINVGQIKTSDFEL